MLKQTLQMLMDQTMILLDRSSLLHHDQLLLIASSRQCHNAIMLELLGASCECYPRGLGSLGLEKFGFIVLFN